MRKAHLRDEGPTKGWPDDKLLAYAQAKLGEGQHNADMAIRLGRFAPVFYFWAGKAFTLLHDRHKGSWKKFQRDHNLAVGTVWEAEQVYRKAIALVPTHGGPANDREAAHAITSGRWGDSITAVKSALGITKEAASTGAARPIHKLPRRGTSESTRQPEEVPEPEEVRPGAQEEKAREFTVGVTVTVRAKLGPRVGALSARELHDYLAAGSWTLLLDEERLRRPGDDREAGRLTDYTIALDSIVVAPAQD
jgi:hypothetical protein